MTKGWEEYHVALIVGPLPSKQYPLNGIFELDQARALHRQGIKVSILSFDLRSLRRKRKLGFYHSVNDGMDVFTASVPLGSVPQRLMSNVALRSAEKLAEMAMPVIGMPDILHAHFAQYGEIGLWLKERYDIPLVYTEHCSLVPKGDQRYISLGEVSWLGADAVIAVSSALGRCMEECCGCMPVVVGNIVESGFASGPLPNHDGTLRFVSTGSLIHGKGHDVLIDAFSYLPKGASLSIFGEGPERLALQNQIDSLGLSDRIHLKGLCSRQIIADSFRSADCFVLASRAETFGVAYIEAMAAGLPVVATACGGPEDFVSEEVGELVPTDDAAALSEAMLRVCTCQRKSQLIRSYTEKYFSANSVAGKLIDIYSSVIERRTAMNSF